MNEISANTSQHIFSPPKSKHHRSLSSSKFKSFFDQSEIDSQKQQLYWFRRSNSKESTYWNKRIKNQTSKFSFIRIIKSFYSKKKKIIHRA